ncbi:MAG TPA: hypothetical protein VI072_28690 [Polyangiaceae bacterium]
MTHAPALSLVIVLAMASGECTGEIDDDGNAAGSSGDGATGGSTAIGGKAGGGNGATSGATSGGSGKTGAGGSGAASGSGGRAGSTGSGGQGGSSGRGGSAGKAGSGGSAGTGGSPGCTPNYACRPTPPPATGNAHADCVARINQFRDCVCMPHLERWTEAESCANQQVAYDRARNAPHAGWTGNICSPKGNGQNECLGGAINGCQQSMYDEGPPPQTPCEGACFQEHGHFINMTNRNFRRVACGFDGSWSVQNYQ